MLAKAPSYKDREWLSRAFEVRAAFPLGPDDLSACASLGIPTWHYGHEPPNAFATSIAKYFANSVREEGLLTLATGGVIYSPGSAGTLHDSPVLAAAERGVVPSAALWECAMSQLALRLQGEQRPHHRERSCPEHRSPPPVAPLRTLPEATGIA